MAYSDFDLERARTELGLTVRTHTSLFAGANMGIWRNTKHVKESMQLLDYFAQPATQLQWFKLTDELPTNLSALNSKSASRYSGAAFCPAEGAAK